MKEILKTLSLTILITAGAGIGIGGAFLALLSGNRQTELVIMSIGIRIVIATGIPLIIHALKEEKQKEKRLFLPTVALTYFM